MSLTLNDVTSALYAEEPDYQQASRLGPDALIHLEALFRRSDPLLASKAVYLASLIKDARSPPLIKEAARSQNAEIRMAAAAAARNLPDAEASDVLFSLVDDRVVGVRKVALNSTPTTASPALKAKLKSLAQQDPNPILRTLSDQVLNKVK